MDKDRIIGGARDFAGKVDGAAGELTGDAKAQPSGKAREAAVLIFDNARIARSIRQAAWMFGVNCFSIDAAISASLTWVSAERMRQRSFAWARCCSRGCHRD